MPILILAPVVLWLLAVTTGRPPEFFDAVPFPLSAGLALGLVALLAGMMRQWAWLYWLALLAGSYWATGLAPQVPADESGRQALTFFLPALLGLLGLLLALLPKPALFSPAGALLLATAAVLPPLTLALPLALPWQALGPPEAWARQSLPGTSLGLPVLAALAAIALGWLLALLLSASRSARWGELACWLAIACMPAFIGQAPITGWAVLAGSLAILLALASQMLRLAYYDELTQLPQRRALQAQLARLGRKSAVAMLDIDHFKQVNDRYGHDVGDQVLRLLGAILGREKGFRAYRYGGEEFTLVFRHADRQVIEEVLEQLRARLAAYPVRIRSSQRPRQAAKGKAGRGGAAKGRQFRVTASIGCALRRQPESAAHLLKRADTLLYKAKQAGRNRVIVKP